MSKLRFFKRRAHAAESVAAAIGRLPEQKYLQFGGESLRMPTATADPNLWQKVFKVSYDHLDQSEIVNRALAMVRWSGKPGESDYEIVDERVKAAVEYKEKTANFDFSRDKLPSIHKFVLQVAVFYAARDIIEQAGATFAGIKCQDELSANLCTACIATSYLGNDVAPDGSPQERVTPPPARTTWIPPSPSSCCTCSRESRRPSATSGTWRTASWPSPTAASTPPTSSGRPRRRGGSRT
jgi:L-fucose isomerase-like protein